MKEGATSKPFKSGPYGEWISLPDVRVKDFITTKVCETIHGPTNGDPGSERLGDVACGSSISTYPKGIGEPVCDYYAAELYEQRTLICLADGCGWGPQPREAAIRATDAYMDYIRTNQKTIFDIKEAGRLILRAFQKAHIKIVEGYEDVWDAGTTTLCGGLLMELEEEQGVLDKLKELGYSLADTHVFDYGKLKDKVTHTSQPHSGEEKVISREERNKELKKIFAEMPDYKWIFICASVGDCKAFHYSKYTGQFTDITAGNRTNLTDAKDPGGRLGPYRENGAADLRNLALYFVPCHEEDLIILVSDGIHDNLDPQTLGITPEEVGIAGYSTWAEAENIMCEKTDKIKNDFRVQFMKKLLLRSLENKNPATAELPQFLMHVIVNHSDELTKPSRKFMEANPNKRLPDDYSLYPGKMDHTTSIVCVAGGLTMKGGRSKAKEKISDKNSSSRQIRIFDMNQKLLAEISVNSDHTIYNIIEQVKTLLANVIEGRAFRLRKGHESFRSSPDPILKKQFTEKAYDLFPTSADVIVIQFGTARVSGLPS
eukprot:TRINITY_DN1850_c0_g1_i1.p1 TRINITY_DN1850_c0_g1~~TRINITY_DN1850_c0_g1_i1.p1  ORF type:complete len:573 (+),score=89.02 TRINITY_DN1850_c0_g1_i1:91-1719(+)